MERPLDRAHLAQDKEFLCAIVTIALIAIGLGVFFYSFGGIAGQVSAYVSWGITCVGCLSVLIAYVARAILSRRGREHAAQSREIFEQLFPNSTIGFDYVEQFSPNLTLSALPNYYLLPNHSLIGFPHGRFDQHDDLNFENGPIIRAKEAGRPFLAV